MKFAKRFLSIMGGAALGLAVAAVMAISAARPLQAQIFKTLYSFQGRQNCTGSGYPDYTTKCTINDGANPEAGLFRDASGNLYGTAHTGGIFGTGDGEGTAFELLNGATTDTLLLNFGVVVNGLSIWSVLPASALVRDKNGNFYGTSNGGE